MARWVRFYVLPSATSLCMLSLHPCAEAPPPPSSSSKHPPMAQKVLSLPTSEGTAQQAPSWGKWKGLSCTPEFALAGQPLDIIIMEGVSSTYHPQDSLGLSPFLGSLLPWYAGYGGTQDMCCRQTSAAGTPASCALAGANHREQSFPVACHQSVPDWETA